MDLLVVGLAQHLDAAEGELPVVGAEVPVVHRQGLLEPRGVGLQRDGHQGDVVVSHVVPADHSRAVGQPFGVAVRARPQQQGGRVHRPAGHDHDVAGERGDSDPSSSVVTTPVTVCPEASVSRRCTWAPVTRVTLSRDKDRIDTDDLRVRLRVEQAREAVDPVAADAGAGPGGPARLRLLEVDPDRQVERVEPELLQVVAQLLDPGLVGDRRMARTAHSRDPRSGPRRARRARGRGARPGV